MERHIFVTIILAMEIIVPLLYTYSRWDQRKRLYMGIFGGCKMQYQSIYRCKPE